MDHDLTLRDVRIWDPLHGLMPAPRSIVIRSGRIEGITSHGGDNPATTMEGGGRVAVPGFVDAHLHLLMGGLHLTRLDLSAVSSPEAFAAAIAAAHEGLPEGEWLIGVGWNESNWGGKLPDRSWLSAAGDRPVVCHRCDLHASLVNEAVLQRLSPALAQGDPPGGRIERDAQGRPTGLLVEAAAWTLVNPLVPVPSVSQRQAAVKRACAHLLALGVTSAGTMEYAEDVRDAIAPMRDELPIRLRVTLLDRTWPIELSLSKCVDADDRLAIIGFKAFIDGTLGSSTARMLDPYVDAPDNRGVWVELAEQGVLIEWAQRVAGAGLQPSMHAIGDAAVRLALDALDALDAQQTGPAHVARVRPRIEHAQQVHPDDLRRFAGRIASMQPLHAVTDSPLLPNRLGAERAAQAYPFRSLLDSGASIAMGSDWPVVAPDPLAAMRSAITGLDARGTVCRPAQRLSVDEALSAHTLHAARALHLDDVGILREGAAGDVVIFEDDPFVWDWSRGAPRRYAVIARGRLSPGAGEGGA